jgi:proteasome lid subunit RPN8/RPN11
MSVTQQEKTPDVRQLRKENLSEGFFPGGRNLSFRVYFDPAIHSRIWTHCTEDTQVEICGVLVGKWARDADGPFVLISEAIRGEAATNKFAEVTFTHATWAKINEQMDSRFTTLSIVGWYHSHPSFGIFLSDRDRFIQEHFFSGAGQIAYVIDPIRKTEGVFVWREGRPESCPHYWVGDRIQVGTPAGKEEVSQPAPEPTSPDRRERAGSPRPESGSSWLLLASQIALYVLVFFLGYMLAGRLTEFERSRLEQNTLARAWLFGKIRPGLREEVALLTKDLLAVVKGTGSLSQEHLKLLEDRKEAEARWKEVFTALALSLKRLSNIETEYCLSPAETAFLESLGGTKPKSAVAEPAKPTEEKKTEKKSDTEPEKK